ncbi:unnamed protein product [Aureobasidium uvarum]|uniref:SAM-dependent methyltransferase Erg6/SMT-type domain-containing protein n=1 Tax=Aureobasidium uvarum TaxID=2773716 RepID=A0A9N8KLH2_9PEZI|nr:unnamed protein product [Aureobasidium uvarum]
MPTQDGLTHTKTYLPKSMTAHLPQTRNDEAWGAQMRTHYTVEENNDKLPANLELLEAEREKRKKNYAQIAHEYAFLHTKLHDAQSSYVHSYYELVTLNLEFAWNKKFHFAPFLDDKQSIREALAAHDHYQFMTMGVKPGMRGLDAGCGIGEPARQYAAWADVHVTGVTITEYQVERANMYAETQGISNKVENCPFPDNTFDFAYAQEATCHAPELRDVYAEICRVLKPGGVVGIGEWCLTDKFDPKNLQHLDVRRRIERGDGIANMKTTKEAMAEFEFAGFEVTHVEDHALKGLQSRPWWIPLDGDTSKFPDRSDWWMVLWLKPAVWKAVKAWVWFKGKIGMFSKVDADSLLEALNTQGQSVWGLRDGGKYGMSSALL